MASVTASSAILAVVTFAFNIFAVVTASDASLASVTALLAISPVAIVPSNILVDVTAPVASSVAVTALAIICALDAVPLRSPPTAGSEETLVKESVPDPSVFITCPAEPSLKFNSAIPTLLVPICAFDTVPVKSPPTAVEPASIVVKDKVPEPSVFNT